MSKQNNQATELFDILVALIEGDTEPVHYKQLTAALQESGFELDKMYKRPSDSIYNMLIGGIRKGCTRYVFMKNGIFASSQVLSGVEELIADPPPVKISVPKEKVRKLPVLNRLATHKDCMFMQYTDLQLLADTQTNHYGYCVKTESGKIYPHKDGPVCEHFIQKDFDQLEREHERKLKLEALISDINTVVSKSARGGNRSEYKERV